MLSSIFLKTLRDLRGLILAWGLGLAAASALNVIFFPAFQDMQELQAFLNKLPPVMKTFLGDLDAVFTLEGFLKIKIFDLLPLLLSIMGIGQAARALSGEAEDKTADMLLALPVSRRRVVAEKFLAVCAAVAAVGAFIALGLIASVAAVGVEMPAAYLVNATLNGLPPTWFVAGLALFGSCALRSSRRAAILATVVLVGSYVFETIRMISPSLADWRAVSMFAHHKSGVSLAGELSWANAAGFTALAVVMLGLAMEAYRRRDI